MEPSFYAEVKHEASFSSCHQIVPTLSRGEGIDTRHMFSLGFSTTQGDLVHPVLFTSLIEVMELV